MEQSLEKHLETLMNTPGVVGVLCADKQGLCLGVEGTATTPSSGLMVRLAELANELPRGNDEPDPVVCLESDNMNILIKSNDNVTTAIYKQPQANH